MIRYNEQHKTLGGGFGRGLAAAALVVLTVLLGGVQSAQAGPLSNTHWRINVKPDAAATLAGRLPFEEFLFVEEYQATAFELARLGFGPILPSLTLDSATGTISFVVNLKSGTQGTVDIAGKMTTTAISGTVVWTKDGKIYNYTFSGVQHTPAAADDVQS